tara:strand:- start:3454 stop:3663 length:210 start_codon:yes stop_codon:yes gene_type:complete
MWVKVRKHGKDNIVANLASNREKLAREIVDSWDMDDLHSYAIDRLEESLKGYTDEEFHDEWMVYVGEDE